MAERFVITAHIGALSGATRLLFKAPTAGNGGGLSILSAHVLSGTTTSSLTLVRHSSAGTPALEGTIAAAIGGTASAFVAGAAKAFTISDAFVDAGEWVGIAEGSVQACDSNANITLVCQMGY